MFFKFCRKPSIFVFWISKCSIFCPAYHHVARLEAVSLHNYIRSTTASDSPSVRVNRDALNVRSPSYQSIMITENMSFIFSTKTIQYIWFYLFKITVSRINSLDVDTIWWSDILIYFYRYYDCKTHILQNSHMFMFTSDNRLLVLRQTTYQM